jgi:hypothetical protein
MIRWNNLLESLGMLPHGTSAKLSGSLIPMSTAQLKKAKKIAAQCIFIWSKEIFLFWSSTFSVIILED